MKANYPDEAKKVDKQEDMAAEARVAYVNAPQEIAATSEEDAEKKYSAEFLEQRFSKIEKTVCDLKNEFKKSFEEFATKYD
ncbi:MAG: hypothetical protein GX766_01830, partial [Firmicutes bacterium]|nr:hypothetical protein [Bacillota bacterium]